MSGIVKPKILSSRVFFFKFAQLLLRSSFSLFDLHYSLGGIKIASTKNTFMQNRLIDKTRVEWYILTNDVDSKAEIIPILDDVLD